MSKKSHAKKAITGVLATGAAVTLGFLSFTGMYALVPLWPLALASFGLAVVYEGQIYRDNISAALEKLRIKHYLENLIARRVLNKLIKDKQNIANSAFLADYQAQLKYVNKLAHKHLHDKDDKLHVAKAQKRLAEMQAYFARYLFDQSRPTDAYTSDLKNIITDEYRTSVQKLALKRQKQFKAALGFSVFAGVSCGLATIYAISSGVATLPIAIPATLLSSATFGFAGLAAAGYTWLIYNAVTRMIANRTVQKWVKTIKEDIQKSHGIKTIALVIGAAIIVTLAAALTLASAGTWWFAAEGAVKLIPLIKEAPKLLTSKVIPFCASVIYGLASLAFTLENSSESFELLKNLSPVKAIKSSFSKVRDAFKQENWGQRLNPFRAVIKLVSIPVRVLAFMGHVVSIGVTTDKVKFGNVTIPPAYPAISSTLSESMEDLHYFVDDGDDHHHHHGGEEGGHTHSDLPSTIIKFALSPLYGLAIVWDFAFSTKTNSETKRDRLKASWKKIWGVEEHHDTLPKQQPDLSSSWYKQEKLIELDKMKTRYDDSHLHLRDNTLRREKRDLFTTIRQQVVATEPKEFENEEQSKAKVGSICEAQLTNKAHRVNEHRNRFFSRHRNKNTAAGRYLENQLGKERASSLFASGVGR